jgi:serine/threonine protein kinase
VTLATGTRLGPYEILASIGAGGMGEVYKAHDTRLGRDVAIKVSNENFTERFEREARAIAALNHPNICTLHDIGPNYLVMELVDGPTLAERINQGPIPSTEALAIASKIADALEAAHEKGIVHRDLKPPNIKITPDGSVKVLDFGLAKSAGVAAASPENSPTLSMATQAGVILGTAAYMSPEQARGKPVDKRADIWAFGCVVFEMLTGGRAFHGETTSDFLAAVIKEEPNLEKVPAHLRAPIEKCLRKDPRARWRCIGDARDAFDEARPSSVATLRSSKWPWAIAAVFAIAAVCAGALYFGAKTPTPNVIRFQILPPEGNSFGIAFAVSPDGKHIAFPAFSGANGQTRLWVRSLDSLEARALPGTEGTARLPWWSPDSRYVAFQAGGKLRKIDISGGPPITICDTPGNVTGGSWSPNGVILFAATLGTVLKVADIGGVTTPVTSLGSDESSTLQPMFLPDGEHFIYVRTSTSGRAIYAASVGLKPEEQSRKPLLNADYAIYASSSGSTEGFLVFLRESTLMAQRFKPEKLELSGEAFPIADAVGAYVNRGLFSASQNGVLAYSSAVGARSQIAWYDRQGKLLSTVTEPGAYNTISLSPDESRAVFNRSDAASQNLWIVDLVRGGISRFTFTTNAEVNPVWSPDGRRIVYTSVGNGQKLFSKDANGAGRDFMMLNSESIAQTWSPDGRFVIYRANNGKTGYDLMVLPLEGDRKPVPFAATQFQEDQAQFSQDGHFVAYVSNASGENEVYVRTFPPGEKDDQWSISSGGGAEPRWRGDGRELYFLSRGRIMAVDISTTPTFHAGVPTLLFEVPVSRGTTSSAHDWDVTKDGKRFLINAASSGSTSSPINVVVNWTAALKK